MVSSGMLRRVAFVRTDVSEESSASFIRVTRIGELRTTLGVTSNRRRKRWFIQEPHGVTYQKTPFFITGFIADDNYATGVHCGVYLSNSNEPVDPFPALYGNRRFIVPFTRVLHGSPS
jgi:hypothetical protein